MDSFCTTCNQIDTDLGLNLYHDHHDYLVMPGVEGFEQTTFPVLLSIISALIKLFWVCKYFNGIV